MLRATMTLVSLPVCGSLHDRSCLRQQLAPDFADAADELILCCGRVQVVRGKPGAQRRHARADPGQGCVAVGCLTALDRVPQQLCEIVRQQQLVAALPMQKLQFPGFLHRQRHEASRGVGLERREVAAEGVLPLVALAHLDQRRIREHEVGLRILADELRQRRPLHHVLIEHEEPLHRIESLLLGRDPAQNPACAKLRAR